MDVLTTTLASVLVAVVASVVTVRLPLARFRSERWWEKTAEAYLDVMEKLGAVSLATQEWLSEEYGEHHLSEERESALNVRYADALLELQLAAARGPLLLSARTVNILNTMLQGVESGHSRNPVDDLELAIAAIAKAIPEVAEEGRSALKR